MRYARILLSFMLLVHGACATTAGEELPGRARTSGHTRLVVLHGEEDGENLHPYTVMVAPYRLSKSKRRGDECSGVHLGPRLVLTAAHCVCEPRQVGKSLVIDRLGCSKLAVVTVPSERPSQEVEGYSELQTRIYRGEVRPHPKLNIPFDNPERAVLMGTADLAVIFLENPVESRFPAIQLADFEPREGQDILVAGYGQSGTRSEKYGLRTHGRNRLTQVLKLTERKLIVADSGAHVLPGDSGGPCIVQQEGKPPLLVGIAMMEGDYEGQRVSFFTNTYTYRDWLREELGRTSM
jgi:hypothetical protein